MSEPPSNFYFIDRSLWSLGFQKGFLGFVWLYLPKISLNESKCRRKYNRHFLLYHSLKARNCNEAKLKHLQDNIAYTIKNCKCMSNYRKGQDSCNYRLGTNRAPIQRPSQSVINGTRFWLSREHHFKIQLLTSPRAPKEHEKLNIILFLNSFIESFQRMYKV